MFNLLINKDLFLVGFGAGIKTKEEQTASVPQMLRIWGKNLALEPNPHPQKGGGEKVLRTFYKNKIKIKLTLY